MGEVDPLGGFTIEDVKLALARVTDEVLISIQVLNEKGQGSPHYAWQSRRRQPQHLQTPLCSGQARVRFTVCTLCLTRLHNPPLGLLDSTRSQTQTHQQHLVGCVSSACKTFQH